VQAAQDIGISQKSFSNLENGHSISAATRKKVEKWLEATDQQPEAAPANDDF
jgi:DNA transposition AAA+ family ATPase